MSTYMRRAARKLATFTAILILIVLAVFLLKPEWVHPATPFLFVLFVGLSIGGSAIANQAKKQDPRMATTLYLGIMTGRLIISLIVLVLFLLLDRSQQLLFVANFFTLYLCYAVFDITGLVANLRPDFREH